MKKTELNKMDVKALGEEVAKLKKELFELKLSATATPVKDCSQFRKLRVRIAQASTFLNQKAQ